MLVNNCDVSNWFKEVSIPNWTKLYSDCHCVASYQCRSHLFPELFVFEYGCKFTFDNFIVLCINSDNHMFGAMKGMWREIAKRFGIAMEDDGRIYDYDLYRIEQSGKGGIAEITRLLYELYRDWKPYENIDDYGTMMKMKSSKDAINKLKCELKNKGLETGISETRRHIEELRQKLVDMENEMTKLYEDAAEAMNFLEEHGCPQEELT